MKKKVVALVLAMVLMMAMTLTAAAAETSLYESTDNGTLDATAIETMQANPDATFVLEYKTGTDEGKNGWGLGGLCFAGWTVDPAFEVTQTAVNSTLKGEWKVSDILAKGTEINVNLYNDASCVRAYLVTADGEVADTTAATTDTAPKTGDTTNLLPVFGVMILAAGAFIITSRKKAAVK